MHYFLSQKVNLSFKYCIKQIVTKHIKIENCARVWNGDNLRYLKLSISDALKALQVTSLELIQKYCSLMTFMGMQSLVRYTRVHFAFVFAHRGSFNFFNFIWLYCSHKRVKKMYLCDGFISDRYSLWRHQESIRPLTSPVSFRAADQTRIM